MRTHADSMRLEANRWRLGIASGEVNCKCRAHGAPLDDLGHLKRETGYKCARDYGVLRIYELERKLARL